MGPPDLQTFKDPQGTTSSGSRTVHSRSTASDGNNCFWGGDGDDHYSGGNGHNEITCGNGNNGIFVGNGNDDVQVGQRNQPNRRWAAATTRCRSATATATTSTVGNGNDTLSFGQWLLQPDGPRIRHRRRDAQGSQNTVTGTSGNDTVYLGGGTGNTFTGRRPPHERLPPTHPPLLMARNSGRLLPRHSDQLHGGEPMSSRSNRRRTDVSAVEFSMFLVDPLGCGSLVRFGQCRLVVFRIRRHRRRARPRSPL